MACTCMAPARCLVCNASVRVPLSNFESSSAGSLLVDRFARRETAANREALRRLIEGSCPCPDCGSTVSVTHSRACFAMALVTAGVPLHERESILSKIVFPEG
ncbi:MAG TPA: hypothetical protein VGV64_08240 [Thermoplasmata archaeon]|nr:hypothetical protein [Thermoplasmata archaeon]HEV2429811.1 hypothetical protein [Thermoplasmata archaeon]